MEKLGGEDVIKVAGLSTFSMRQKCIGFILLVCDLDNVHISSSGPLFYESWAVSL